MRERLDENFTQNFKTAAVVFEDGEIFIPGRHNVRIEGFIYLVLRKGVAPEIKDEDGNFSSNFVRKFAEELHLSNRVKTAIQYDLVLKHAANFCHLVPTLKWPNKKLKTFLKCYTLLIFFDNYLKESSTTEHLEQTLGANYILTLRKVISDVFEGKYKTVREIPCENNFTLQAAFKFLFLCYHELSNTCLDYHQKCKPLVAHLKNWIIQQKLNSKYSNRTYPEVRREAGFAVILELVALIDGVELSDLARDYALLEGTRRTADLMLSWSIDLIQLRKAVVNQRVPSMKTVVWKLDEDPNAETTIRNFFRCQQAHAIDYIRLRETLKEWSEDDLVAQQYLTLMDNLVDGFVKMELKKEDGESRIHYKITDSFISRTVNNLRRRDILPV